MKYSKTPVVVELGEMKFPNADVMANEQEDFLKNNPDQVFVKTFFFATDDTKIIKQMENAVWVWLSNTNAEVVSSSQSLMVKDGKYHLILVVFFKYKNKE